MILQPDALEEGEVDDFVSTSTRRLNDRSYRMLNSDSMTDV